MDTITDHITYDHGNTELGALRAIAHLAATLHDRQYAGMSITPVMWYMLHQLCNEAKALRSDEPYSIEEIREICTKADR